MPNIKIYKTFLSLAIIIGLAIVPAIVYAQPEIEVSGNKRTKDNYIEKLSHICLAKYDEEKARSLSSNAEVLRQAKQSYLQRCINGSGLFSSVIIEEFSEQKIVIQVKDKWSFLVLPSYSAGQTEDSVVWGLLFFDFNLGGRGQAFGFIYQKQPVNNLDTYSFLYDAPYIDKQGKYGFSFALFDRNQNFFSYDGKDWTYKVNENFRFLWLRLKHRITDEFALTYGYAPTLLAFSEQEYRDGRTPEPIENPAQNIQSITLGPEWSNTERRYYYEKGFRAGGTIYHQASNSQKTPDTAVEINLYAGVPTIKQQVFQWDLKGGSRTSIEPYNSWRVGGEIGSRGVQEDGIWGQDFLSSSFDYQVPATQGRYGYWNFGPFLDAGHIWNVLHNPEAEDGLSYLSYGLSSYVHLRQVNVPAFGISVGGTNLYDGLFSQFFVGYRF